MILLLKKYTFKKINILKKTGSLALTLSFLCLFPFINLQAIPEYRVVIDPGHGGSNIRRKDDKWDPVSEQYLESYLPGMTYKNLTEHEVMLQLARRVEYYLKLTETASGWEEFQKILETISGSKEFPRIQFKTMMSREDSWNHRGLPANDIRTNAPYRLYDFPDPDDKSKILPGRISAINNFQPHLVVSLHLNPAGKGNPGGMTAVLAPGYRTFDLLRKITLKKASVKEFNKLPWSDKFLLSDRGWNHFQSARADAWVYFHGYRCNKAGTAPWLEKNRGIRYNMVQWRYADGPEWITEARKKGPGRFSMKYTDFEPEGSFFDRERSQAEAWRREDGPLGYGGDNHLASDELLRFAQYGTRRFLNKKAEAILGPIQQPYVSTYAMPTFVNAINAYLEIGHLNRSRDRALVIGQREVLAKSLAAGIYSLFVGLKPAQGKEPYRPRGTPVDFKKYENLPEGNYFEIVTKKK